MDTIMSDWNEHFLELFVPNIIWYFLCLFLGVFGNSFVLVFYIFQMKRHWKDRYFIPVLAAFDLFAILFATVQFIIGSFNYVTYPSSTLCVIINFICFFTTCTSAHFLLVIGIQRYLKVCRANSFRMTLRWKRVALGMTMFIAISYSIPVFFSAGIKHVNWIFKGQNVTATICLFNAKERSGFSLIFTPVILVIVGLNIAATVVVYFKIGCVVYKTVYNTKMRQKGKRNLTSNNEVEQCASRSDFATETEDDALSNNDFSETGESRDIANDNNRNININVKQNIVTTSSVSVDMNDKDKAKSKRRTKRTKSRINFNYMFLTIVAFYLLSYIPTGIILALSSSDELYFLKLQDSYHGLISCLQNFYIVNHLVNPFIYAYFDFRFRDAIKMLLRKLFKFRK